MADIGEAVFGGNLVRPTLHGRAVHFHGLAAGTAHQVVMVCVAATALDTLAVLADDHVDIAGISERGECAIDGC